MSDHTMTTDQAREHLVQYMEQHFTDRTFHRYILGQRGDIKLAGDFAWQMAVSLKRQADQHDQLLAALHSIKTAANMTDLSGNARCMAISDMVDSALRAASATRT